MAGSRPPVLSSVKPSDEYGYYSASAIQPSQHLGHGQSSPKNSSGECNRADARHTPSLSRGPFSSDEVEPDNRITQHGPRGQGLILQAMKDELRPGDDDDDYDDDGGGDDVATPTTSRARSPPAPALPVRNPSRLSSRTQSESGESMEEHIASRQASRTHGSLSPLPLRLPSRNSLRASGSPDCGAFDWPWDAGQSRLGDRNSQSFFIHSPAPQSPRHGAVKLARSASGTSSHAAHGRITAPRAPVPPPRSPRRTPISPQYSFNSPVDPTLGKQILSSSGSALNHGRGNSKRHPGQDRNHNLGSDPRGKPRQSLAGRMPSGQVSPQHGGSPGHLSRPSGVAQSSPVPRHRSGSFGSISSRASGRDIVMVNYVYQKALQMSLVDPEADWQGVVLRKSRGEYACYPPQLRAIENGLYDAALEMNVDCVMTVDSPVTRTILKSMELTGLDHVPLAGGLRIQVLKTMADLPGCKLNHFAAFVQDIMAMIVWDDDAAKLLKRVEDMESRFVKVIWGDGRKDSGIDQQNLSDDASATIKDEEGFEPRYLEAGNQNKRPIRLLSSFMTAATLCVACACVGVGWRKLAVEITTDGHWARLWLISLFPAQLFVSLFFFQALVGNISQILGPVNHLESNSTYFSGKPPKRRLRRHLDVLPHVTVQMPVYKESLNTVLRPTVMSVKAAISTYEMQGGTANIFVNDDGMQLLSTADAQARREFYDQLKIGWVARPKHGGVGRRQKPFARRGKFNKASNMNYSLDISNRVEMKLEGKYRKKGWNQVDEQREYAEALAQVLEEDNGTTMAAGNIRLGDYILLIDCDTRVPEDCFLAPVSEMEQAPQVAIIQFASAILQVSESYFEKGVTWFTNLIYNAITYSVANGDCPPFVGHNAFLRWEAIQDAAAYYDPEDGFEKYWPEDCVSEDFAMALKLQSHSYTIRFGSYAGEGFKEGVSLTVYDELARWEKYAYGCNELMFNPLRLWLTRGPITPLFRQFIGCKHITFHHKTTIIAYMGTFYAMAAAFHLTAMNYLLTGWEWGIFDKFYLDSFTMLFSIICVFTALGNIALAVLRFRLKQGGLLMNLWVNLKWIPMFNVFLGGVSLHLSQAILCHFFEIDLSWGATAKEVEGVVFGREVVRIVRDFKGTFVLCGLSVVGMVYLFWFAPPLWQIRDFPAIFPFAMVVACHLLLPLVLSPPLMRWSW